MELHSKYEENSPNHKKMPRKQRRNKNDWQTDGKTAIRLYSSGLTNRGQMI